MDLTSKILSDSLSSHKNLKMDMSVTNLLDNETCMYCLVGVSMSEPHTSDKSSDFLYIIMDIRTSFRKF